MGSFEQAKLEVLLAESRRKLEILRAENARLRDALEEAEDDFRSIAARENAQNPRHTPEQVAATAYAAAWRAAEKARRALEEGS